MVDVRWAIVDGRGLTLLPGGTPVDVRHVLDLGPITVGESRLRAAIVNIGFRAAVAAAGFGFGACGHIGHRTSAIGHGPGARAGASPPPAPATPPRTALVAVVVERVALLSFRPRRLRLDDDLARRLRSAIARSGVPRSLFARTAIALALVAPPLISRALVPAALPALLLAGGRLQRRDGSRTVLHDAFERARAPLVEVEPARHRLEPHLQALHLDARARQLEDEVVDDLVVQRLDGRVRVVQLRLDVKRVDQRVRVQ